MNLLKNWAKKILKDEFNELEGKVKYYMVRADELQDRCNDMHEAKLEAMKTIRERNEKLKELKQENVILKKYYHLYDEPTEEQEIEIRTKLRVLDMQKEIDRYKSMLPPPRIYFPELPVVCNGANICINGGVAYRY